MCIIVYKPAGVEMPANTILKNCFENNRDGIGLMYREKTSKVRVLKGFMTLTHFNKALKNLGRNTDLLNTDVVIHFRLATHGTVVPGNCHPFPVTSSYARMQATDSLVNKALAHNGILMAYAPPKELKVSDTMFFIKKNYKNINRALNGAQGKFVLMEKTKTSVFGDFVQSEGVYYSNSTFMPTFTHHHNFKPRAKANTPEVMVQCCDCGDRIPLSGAFHLKGRDYLCSECYYEMLHDCMELCDECGKIVPASKTTYKNRKFICEACAEALNVDWWELQCL